MSVIFREERADIMLNLLIVEDQNIVSDLLEAQLKNYSFKCKKAPTWMSALNGCKQSKFDIILLDLKLDLKLSLDDIEELLTLAHPAKIVLFTSSEDVEFIQTCLQKGVYGVIPKYFSISSLVNTIKLIESGQKFIPLKYQGPATPTEASDKIHLTSIERRVLQKLSIGSTNNEIATELKISDSMAKLHVRRLCQKLQAKNRTQAALIALNLGLIARSEL